MVTPITWMVAMLVCNSTVQPFLSLLHSDGSWRQLVVFSRLAGDDMSVPPPRESNSYYVLIGTCEIPLDE